MRRSSARSLRMDSTSRSDSGSGSRSRVYFREASFVILDEPTAALDARPEEDQFDRIRALLAGRSVLLISHRFSTVRHADRIHVLERGSIIETGAHDDLVADDGLYAELFRAQAAAYG